MAERKDGKRRKHNMTFCALDDQHYTKEETINILKPYLQRGKKLRKACELAGFDIKTVNNWRRNDKKMSAKVVLWQNQVALLSDDHLIQAIQRGERWAIEIWINKHRTSKEDYNDDKTIQFKDITENGEPDEELEEVEKLLLGDYEEETTTTTTTKRTHKRTKSKTSKTATKPTKEKRRKV